MPWCPVCKNEYIEGKTHCPDCDVDLVDELPEEEEEAPVENILTEEEKADLETRRAVASQMKTHTSARSKYAEVKSSAWTFLAVGGIGLVVIILALLGIISLPLNRFSLFVMGAMFLIFLGISFASFQSASRVFQDISKEDDLESRIKEWAADHLNAGELTAGLEESITSEEKYFTVSERIRIRIMQAFPEVDDAYAEELTETFYNELF